MKWLICWYGKHLLAIQIDDADDLKAKLALFDKADSRLKPYADGLADLGASAVIDALGVTMGSAEPPPPKCPKHGLEMRMGKGGKWFCTRKEMGNYCSITIDRDGKIDYGKRARDPRRARD